MSQHCLRPSTCLLHVPRSTLRSRWARNFSLTPSIAQLPRSTAEQWRQEWKHPPRGGRNLSERYARLEKMVRGKKGYEQRKAELSFGDESGYAPTAAVRPPKDTGKKTFMGFVLPEKPKPPAPDECCMSGCAICVLDLYEEALADYKKAVATLRASLSDLQIPEDQWPPCIRTSAEPAERKQNVALTAFEELERQLREKSERQASSQDMSTLSEVDAVRRGRGRRTMLPSFEMIYEGLRWVLFSNR